MGIGIVELYRLFEHERLGNRPLRLLDIGSQNLSVADKDTVVQFVRRHNDVWNTDDLEKYAERMALGATKHPRFGGTNGSWLGDLMGRIGVDYTAFDIFDGFKTVIFDLNEEDLGPQWRGAFDLVMNCGTTEHVLNQMNSFRVIHDATKVGGLMYHSLPMTGFLDHGYFNYNPRLFLELAQANGYKVVSLDYSGPASSESVISQLVHPYAGQVKIERVAELEVLWTGNSVPTSSLNVLLEKISDKPFRASLETSTTVGGVAAVVSGESQAMIELQRDQAAMLTRLDDPRVTAEEIFALFERQQAIMPHRQFPLLLERKTLELFLKRTPDRQDLQSRLRQVNELLLADTPLLKYVSRDAGVGIGAGQATMAAAMDGKEERIMAITSPAERFDNAVAAYSRYALSGILAMFPPELECAALQHALQVDVDNSACLVRLGRVLTELTPRMKLRRR
jgi:SAM-dependent methyltransferase